MLYIFDTYFKDNISIFYAIQKILGIGKHRAKLMLNDLNISRNYKVNNLTHSILNRILKWVDLNKILVINSSKQKISLGNNSFKLPKSNKNLKHIKV